MVGRWKWKHLGLGKDKMEVCLKWTQGGEGGRKKKMEVRGKWDKILNQEKTRSDVDENVYYMGGGGKDKMGGQRKKRVRLKVRGNGK